MAQIASIRGEWPEVTVRIESTGRLDLGNVSRLLQRVNTGVRAVYPDGPPRVEIASLEDGSIILRIAVLSAVLTAGQLALQISDHLQNNAAGARACRDLFEHDSGSQIIILGGKQNITVAQDDIQDVEAAARMVAGSRGVAPTTGLATFAEGTFAGTIERILGEYYIQLTDRPGLFLRIQDERDDQAPWQEHHQYRVEGRAYFAPVGKPSAFIVRNSMEL